jgi:uncharacterized protein (DUF2132 family)
LHSEDFDKLSPNGITQPQPPAEVSAKPPAQARNPLHGVTLEVMVTALVEHYGWDDLGQRIHIRSFVLDPSVASSLKFLRKTPWAREKVESLYLFMLREQKRPVQQRRSDSPT